jgi:hypothetical protein
MSKKEKEITIGEGVLKKPGKTPKSFLEDYL